MRKLILFISTFLILFQVAAQNERYWVNGSGDWNDQQHWSIASGGNAGASIPNNLSNVFFDENSNLNPEAKINILSPESCKDLNILVNGVAIKGKGNLTIAGSTRVNKTASFKKYKGDLIFASSSKSEIDLPVELNSNIIFNNKQGSWDIESNISTKKDIKLKQGSVNTKGKTIEADLFQTEGSLNKSLDLGESKVIVNSWDFAETSNLNFDAGTSVIMLNNIEKEFISGGLDYNLLATKGAAALIINATPSDPLCPVGSDPGDGSKEDGNINVIVDPVGDYYITIITTADATEVARNFGNSLNFSLPPGNYEVRASSDGYNTNYVTEPNIIINFAPNFLATISVEKDVDCFGGNDLQLRVDAAGGAAPIADYIWFENELNVPALEIGRGIVSPNLGGGGYQAIVIDNNGCYAIDGFKYYPSFPDFDDYVTGPDEIQASNIVPTGTCSNANSGIITIGTTDGGDGTYNYYISTNGGDNPAPGDFTLTSVISNLSAETYHLWIKDGKDCIVKHPSTITIDAIPEPFVDAGAGGTICADDTYTIADSDSSEVSSILWINLTTNDGTGFDDPSKLNPIYTPSATDITNGTVTLQLTGVGNGSCVDMVVSMVLNITALPTPFAGANTDNCGKFYNTTTATQSDFTSTVQWTQISGPATATITNPTAVLASINVNDVYGTYVFQLEETLNACSNTSLIEVEFIARATANAGPNGEICAGETFQLTGTSASNNSGIAWINLTTNDGTGFDDPTSITPIYTPSQADTLAGSVQLRLIAYGNTPCGDVNKTITLTIHENPVVYAGANTTTCGSYYKIADATLTPLTATANWTILTQPSGSNVTWTPSNNTTNPEVDVTTFGTYVFELTATNGGICTESSTVEITFVEPIAVNAGSDDDVCDGDSYKLENATSISADTYLWVVSPIGSGTFDDNSLLQTTFTPTAGSGTFRLILRGSQSAGTCPAQFSSMFLTVNEVPTANAGVNKATCGLSFTLEGTESVVGSTYAWSQISGPGTSNFAPPTDKNAVVTVSTYGVYVFQMEETIGGCSDVATVEITFINAPTSVAGPDAAICIGDTYDVSGSGINYDEVEWVSMGDGGFTDPISENTTYTPGPNDITNGSVILKFITKQTLAVCPDAESQLTLTINPLPIPNITGDMDVCLNDIVTYTTDAGMSNYVWTVVDGTIQGPTNTVSVNILWDETIPTTGPQVSVSYTNGNGCAAATPTDEAVVVNPLPVVSFTAEINNACTGSTGNRYETQDLMANYQWTVPAQGNITSGGTATDNFVEIEWLTAGSYKVTVNYENANGCTATNPTESDVTVIDGPTAYAGADANICHDGDYQITDATAANNIGVAWYNTTTNDATGFVDEFSLTPTYTPSDADKLAGFIELVLTSNSATCGSVTDTMILTLADQLVASVGAPTPFFIGASTDIKVSFRLSHEKISDLDFYLVAPDGATEMLLHTHAGGCIMPFAQTLDTLSFSTTAADGALNFCTLNTQPIISGDFSTSDPWSTIYGLDPAQGGWAIKIIDKKYNDVGELIQGMISFTDINVNTGLSQTIAYDSKELSPTYPIVDPTAAGTVFPTTYYVPIGLRTSCFGECDARAIVNVIGGTPPYVDYSWDSGENGDVVDLCAGFWTVTVTDSKGCITTTSVEVLSPDPMILALDSTDVACFGDNVGMASVKVTDGTAPYTYLWDDVAGTTNDTIYNATPGTYTVTVTDASGCTMKGSIIVNGPSAKLDVNSIIIAPTNCNTNTGTITVTATGGTPALAGYEFLWEDGITTDNPRTNLAVGAYTLTITDSLGCTLDTTINMTDKGDMVITGFTETTSIVCHGENNAEVDVLFTGGVGTYTYDWSLNSGTVSTDPTLLNAMGDSTYTVIVTDVASACSASDVWTVLQPDTLVNTIVYTQPIVCAGDKEASFYAAVTGGIKPYSFEWTNSVGVVVSNDSILELVSADKYYITILDANGCSYLDSVEIIDPLPLVVSTSSNPTTTCGATDGTAKATPTGGLAPYTFQWYKQTDPSTIIATTDEITALAVDIYVVEVSDALGCITSETVIVESTGGFDFTFGSIVLPTCKTIPNGSAEIVGLTGTAPYNFQWYNNANETTKIATQLPVGTTQVLVTDNTGCSKINYITMSEADVLDLLVKSYNSFIADDGKAEAIAIGGIGNKTYLWESEDGSMTATNPFIDNLSIGKYYITVEDELTPTQCIIKDSIEIISDELSYDTLLLTHVICFDDNSGEIEVIGTVNEMKPDYVFNYTWSNTETTPKISDLIADDYELIVELSATVNGVPQVLATITDVITLNHLNPNYSVSFIVDSTNCTIPNGSLEISNESGGLAPYNYTWTNSNGTVLGTLDKIENLGVDTYYLEVNDALGCTYNKSQFLPDTSLMYLTNFVKHACNKQNNGYIEVKESGGIAPHAYQWYNGMGTDLGNNSLSLLNVGADNYTIIATDVNGCVRGKSIPVLEPDSTTFQFVDTTLNVCYNDMIGEIKIDSIKGGWGGPLIFDIFDSNNNKVQTVKDSVFTNLPSDIYTVTIKDSLLCKSEPMNYYQFSKWPQVIIHEDDVNITPASCNKFVEDGAVIIDTIYTGYFDTPMEQITGTVIPPDVEDFYLLTYKWNDDSDENKKSIYNVKAETQTLDVIINNCVSTFEFDVPYLNPMFIDDAYFFSSVSSTTYGCEGEIQKAFVQTTGAIEFAWTSASEILTDPTKATIDVLPTTNNLYNIEVTSAEGCRDTASVTAFVYIADNELNARIIDNDTIVFEGNIIELVADTIEYSHQHMDDYSIAIKNSYTWIDTLKIGEDFLTRPDTISPSVRPSRSNIYIVTDSITIYNPVYGNKVCVHRDSVSVVVLPDFNPPSGFSPNGDGTNDKWQLPGVGGYEKVSVQVFNRWGGIVWTFDGNYEGNEWDGTNANGKPLPSGTYYYVISYGDENGEKSNSGPITILR